MKSISSRLDALEQQTGGGVDVRWLSDEALTAIIRRAGGPDVDLSDYTDAELSAIVGGRIVRLQWGEDEAVQNGA